VQGGKSPWLLLPAHSGSVPAVPLQYQTLSCPPHPWRIPPHTTPTGRQIACCHQEWHHSCQEHSVTAAWYTLRNTSGP
jgi:hypothetical protein